MTGRLARPALLIFVITRKKIYGYLLRLWANAQNLRLLERRFLQGNADIEPPRGAHAVAG
jgi:hypothetical protein